MMGFFSRKEAVKPLPKKTAAPTRAAPGSAVAPRAGSGSTVRSANPQAPEDAQTHFASYADIPKFLSILTDGDESILKLTPQDRLTIVVIELTGRKAQIISSSEKPVATTLLESVRGAFRTDNYSIMPLKTAPNELIAEIYRSTMTSGVASNGKTANQYKDACRGWVEYALENDATDIHMETHGSSGAVRFRIHGEIEDMRADNLGRYTSTFIVNCMGTLYNQLQQKKSSAGSQFEADKNLYCMIPYTDIPGHSLKLRYQSIKGNEGPKVVMRLLHINADQKTKGFAELGYSDSHCRMLDTAMGTPSGAVLISGITGSGKSTTQKSFIELNPNAPNSAIYTVEDPVEYPIKHTHQVPIQRDLSNPAESARLYNETISALMRLDPDIGMLGEIRDRFSAMALQQLIESGHMGLGTIHAHLLSGIVPRLTNPEIGMNREVLTSPNMLTLLVYQALVPRLCPVCAYHSSEAVKVFDDVREVVTHLQTLDLSPNRFRWKRMGGCDACKQRGTIGLTVVAEMMMPDDDWLKLIRQNRDTEAVAHYRSSSDGDLTSPNMDGKTAFEHVLYKAHDGMVDARQCSRFDVWSRYMKQNKAASQKVKLELAA